MDTTGIIWVLEARAWEMVSISADEQTLEIRVVFAAAVRTLGLKQVFQAVRRVDLSKCVPEDPLRRYLADLPAEEGYVKYLDEAIHAVHIWLQLREILRHEFEPELESRFRSRAAESPDRVACERETIAELRENPENAKQKLIALLAVDALAWRFVQSLGAKNSW